MTDIVQISEGEKKLYPQTHVQAILGLNSVGTNLAIGTNQEYAMSYGIPTTTWTDGYAYLKLPTNVTNGEILPADSYLFWGTLTQGVTYTQTIWFETDATVKDLSTVQITWFTKWIHDYQPAIVQKLGQNSYKVASTYLWPGKSDNSVRLFDIEHLDSAFDLSTGTYLKFGKLKLEKGSLSTDYSPNPLDISTSRDVQAEVTKQIKANQPDLSGFQKASDVQNAIASALGKVDVSQTMNDSLRNKLQTRNKEIGS